MKAIRMALRTVSLLIFFVLLGCGGPGGPTAPPLKPLPTDYPEIRQLETQASDMAINLMDAGNAISVVMTEIADWAKSQDLIQNASVDSDQLGVTIQFKSGQYSGISVVYEMDDGSQGQCYNPSPDIGKQEAVLTPAFERTIQANTSTFTLADNPRFACYVCFGDHPYLYGSLREHGYVGDRLYDPAAPSVEDFAKLDDFSIVFINTHTANGGQRLITGEKVPESDENIQDETTQFWIDGKPVFHQYLIVNEYDAQNHTIHEKHLGYYYAITTNFINTQFSYPTRQFKPGSIIILNSCHTADYFAQAFRDVNATTVLSWTSIAWIKPLTWLNQLFDAVCPSDPAIEPIPLFDAWKDSEARKDHEYKYPDCDLVIWGKDGKEDLICDTAEPSANPIPILKAAGAEKTATGVDLVLTGTFGTNNQSIIQVLLDPLTDWSQKIDLQTSLNHMNEFRASIPGNMNYGKYQIRVKANGILSNVIEQVLSPPGHINVTIGSTLLTFQTAYAFWVPEMDYFTLFLEQQPGNQSVFPWATLVVDVNASSLSVGNPAPVDIAIGTGTATGWMAYYDDDGNSLCNITFTRLELAAYGKVSGSFSGPVITMPEPYPIVTYPISGTFTDVMVFTTPFGG